MIQDPPQGGDKSTWTEGDEFRMGGRIFSDVKSLIEAGKPVPDELYGALRKFHENAAAMSYGADPDRSEAWRSMWAAIEGGLKTVTEKRAQADEFAAEGFAVPEQAPLSEYQEYSPPDPYKLPDALPSMDSQPFDGPSPENRRRYSILTNPAEKTDDGRQVVRDSEGEVWDLTPALAAFQNPQVRDELRQSLQGVIPGPAVLSNTLGAMGMAQATAQAINRVQTATGLQQGKGFNIKTAQPGLVLPWGLPSMPDLEEKLKDPLWTRALSQTVNDMTAAGELKPGTAETLFRVGAGLLDFYGFAKGVGALSEGAGKLALASGLPRSSLPGLIAETAAAGRGSAVFPLNTGFGRMAADFMAYNVGTKAFDDRTTLTQDVWSGFEQAAVFAGLGLAARLTRLPAQYVGGKLLSENVAPVLRAAKPAAMQSFEELYANVRKFAGPTLTSTLEKLEAAPHVKQAIKSGVDSYLMGVYSHAYAESQQAPQGQRLSAFWHAILSGPAQATGLAFALGAAVQASVETRRQVNGFMQSPEGQTTLRSIADRLASPQAGEDVRSTFAQFDAWAKTDPKAFDGLVKMTEAQRQWTQEEEAKQLAFRRQVEATTPEQQPMQAEGLLTPSQKFAQRAEEQPMLGEREFTTGEMPKEDVQGLGFKEHAHAVNAVNEYLRVVEGDDSKPYTRFSEIPRAVVERTLKWREEGKPPPEPLTVGEAGELAAETEHQPAYEGMAPIERALVAKAKDETRRPSIGRALRLVSDGTKDRDWLRATYPEAAGQVGDEPVDRWAGRFERVARAAWRVQQRAKGGATPSAPPDVLTPIKDQRTAIETGSAAKPPTGELADTFAGDPRFAGMKPPEIEREVDELRAQAAAGDPGPVLAGPAPTTRDLTLQAASGYRRLLDDLRALDAVPIDGTPNSPEAMEAVMRLAAGDLMATPEGTPDAKREELFARAREVREQHRTAIRSLFDEAKQPEAGTNVAAAMEAVAAKTEGREMQPDAKQRLSKLGWLDEFGDLKSFWEEKVQADTAELLWHHTKAFEAEDGFHSGVPLAFGGRKFTRVEEAGIGSLLSWQKLYGAEWFRNVMQSKFWRGAFKKTIAALGLPGINAVNTGPLSRPQSDAMLREVRQNQLYRGLTGAENRNREMRMAWIVHQLFTPMGGLRLPQEHSDFFDWGHTSGAFKNARSPADFERLKPGTGYLFPIYTQMADLFEEVARAVMPMGLLSPEQYAAWGQGKYLAQAYITEQKSTDAQELGKGNIPNASSGRMKMRSDGRTDPTEGLMRIHDAPYQAMKGIRDWSLLARVVGDWWEPIHQGRMRTAAEVASMHPLEGEDYMRAGVRITPTGGRSVVDEVAAMAKTGEYAPETLIMSARLQGLEDGMLKPGEPPSPGKRPYSPELDLLIKTYLGEGKQGVVYVPKTIMQDMAIAGAELFSQPGNSLAAKVGHALDLFGGFSKRGLSALRPAMMAMDLTSSAMNNHAGRAVPLWDFLAGISGVRSFTGDGLRAWRLYSKLAAEGLPKEKPDSWSSSDWAAVLRAKKAADLAGYSTMIFTSISPDVANSHASAADNPYSLKSALLADLDRQAQANGWTLSQTDQLKLRIVELAGRTARGLEAVDMKIGELMDEADPAAHARGIARMAAQRNLAEFFMFKYPAILKAQHEWPDSPYDKVVTYAIGKTSNAADTNPMLRRWLSMHTPWNDKLWQAAQGSQGKAWAKMIAAQLIRNRFYSYPATMKPQFIRWALTNPLGMSATAGLTAGMAALVWQAMHPDDRKGYEQEMATSRNAAVHWMALRQSEQELYARALTGYQTGSFTSMLKLSDGTGDLAKHAVQLWRTVAHLDPWAVAMPSHGGETRVGSIGQMSPAGFLLDDARGYVNLANAATGAGDGRGEELMNGLDRIYGITAQAVVGTMAGVITGKEPLIQALAGKGTVTQALADHMSNIFARAGVLYPKLGMFTPEGIFIGENVATGGQSWKEALQGIVRPYNPQDAGQNIGASALKILWPSRSLYQRPPLREPADAWTSMLSELYGPGFDPSTAEGRAAMRAGLWSHAQLGVIFGDLYAQHFDEGGEPGKADVSLDDRIAGALRETLEHTTADQFGSYSIEPGYQPKGLLLSAVAGKDPADQAATLKYLVKYATSDSFQQDGMNMLRAAGNARELPKAVFRDAMMNAMADPSGTRLISWWKSQVETGDYTLMGHLAPLIYDVQQPSGGKALEDWAYILAQYAAKGVRLPPLPEQGQASVDAELGKIGAARALQGAPAFKNVLKERQGALDQLMAPRR